MQSVELADTLTLTRNDTGELRVSTNLHFLPNNEKNLAAQAALRWWECENAAPCGLDINIEKHIPVCAGLAGGRLRDYYTIDFLLREAFFVRAAIQNCCHARRINRHLVQDSAAKIIRPHRKWDVFGEWQRMRGFLRPAFSLNSVQNYIYKPGAELLLLIIDVRGHIW